MIYTLRQMFWQKYFFFLFDQKDIFQFFFLHKVSWLGPMFHATIAEPNFIGGIEKSKQMVIFSAS